MLGLFFAAFCAALLFICPTAANPLPAQQNEWVFIALSYKTLSIFPLSAANVKTKKFFGQSEATPEGMRGFFPASRGWAQAPILMPYADGNGFVSPFPSGLSDRWWVHLTSILNFLLILSRAGFLAEEQFPGGAPNKRTADGHFMEPSGWLGLGEPGRFEWNFNRLRRWTLFRDHQKSKPFIFLYEMSRISHESQKKIPVCLNSAETANAFISLFLKKFKTSGERNFMCENVKKYLVQHHWIGHGLVVCGSCCCNLPLKWAGRKAHTSDRLTAFVSPVRRTPTNLSCPGIRTVPEG